MPRTKSDLGAPDHIHAGTDGQTRLAAEWLPDRGVDLVPDFVLVGLETFECEGVVRSLLVFQHREMAAVLRTYGLLDPETRRHPACEFVLIPGSSPNPGRWIENGGTDHALAMARETPGPMNESLARRVFTTVPGGIFVADGALPLAEFPETERWVPASGEEARRSPSAAELPVFAANTRPPQLMARTPVVQLLCSALQPSPLIGGNARARLHPATNISRNGVEDWCRVWGMRLPTSREWRVALRGGSYSQWRWFFGNDETLMSRRRVYR